MDLEKEKKIVEKLALILENIESINERIEGNKLFIKSYNIRPEHYLNRVEIDKKIKTKLIRYYNNLKFGSFENKN